jgi:nicotinamidase-related amidase
VKTLLDRARAAGMLIVHTLGANTSFDSINPALKAIPGEPVFPGRPDKFLGTDLDQVLRGHGIKTVITTGTFTNGAVLYTASEAAFRGYGVLVPIDGISGLTPYADQMTVWQLLNGPRLGGDTVKLTTTNAIRFVGSTQDPAPAAPPPGESHKEFSRVDAGR